MTLITTVMSMSSVRKQLKTAGELTIQASTCLMHTLRPHVAFMLRKISTAADTTAGNSVEGYAG
jgi:hypothetical protein